MVQTNLFSVTLWIGNCNLCMNGHLKYFAYCPFNIFISPLFDFKLDYSNHYGLISVLVWNTIRWINSQNPLLWRRNVLPHFKLSWKKIVFHENVQLYSLFIKATNGKYQIHVYWNSPTSRRTTSEWLAQGLMLQVK